MNVWSERADISAQLGCGNSSVDSARVHVYDCFFVLFDCLSFCVVVPFSGELVHRRKENFLNLKLKGEQ